MSFLSGLGDTMKSFGSAALSGVGLVYDTAAWVIPGNQWGDGDDEGGFFSGNVGGYLDSVAQRFGQLTDPLTNEDTLTGFSLNKGMEGLSWAYHEGVDQPLSTAWQVVGATNPYEGLAHGEYFSGENWANAYDIAERQSIGQSIVNSFSDPQGVGVKDEYAGTNTTPFHESDFYKEHTTLATSLALGADLAVAWYLDPGVILGKGVAFGNQELRLGALRNEDRMNLSEVLAGDAGGRRDWANRFDNYLGFINGDNKLKRPLTGAEIHAVTPELSRSAKGRAIAGLLGDALKIDDVAQRENAARRIVAVAAGDLTEIERLKSEIGGTAAIADALKNIASGKTVDLMDQALVQTLKDSPAFRVKFQQQIDNLDEGDDIKSFVSKWSKETEAKLSAQKTLEETAGRLDNVPGLHTQRVAGKTSEGQLAVAHGDGLSGKIEKGHDAVLDRARRMANRDSYSNVFQKSLYHVPYVVAQPMGWAAAPMTKWAPAAIRNLRQTHFQGVVNLHDWDGASDQLNSMMRIAGVADDVRMAELSKAYTARTEAERLRVIERVEHVSMNGLAQKLTAQHGIEIDKDFLKESMLRGQRGRGATLESMEGGRIYAATKAPEDMALRMRNTLAAQEMGKLDNMKAAERLEAREAAELKAASFQPRIDQILDEDGTALALPLITSQLGNHIPLLDIDRMSKLATDRAWTERLGAHSDMFREAARELDGAKGALARAVASGNKSAIARAQRAVEWHRTTTDAVLDAASAFNRVWKMSVLFRLGYPMRVVADDHMRIAAKIGYMPFLAANLPEASKNVAYNIWGRRKESTALFKRMQADREVLKDVLGRNGVGRNDFTDANWDELQGHLKTFLAPKTAKADRAAARKEIDRLDPDGYTVEYYDLMEQVAAAGRSASSYKGTLSRLRNPLSEEGADAAAIEQKIAQAEAKLAEREGAREQLLAQAEGLVDPAEYRRELRRINDTLDAGKGALRPEKRHVGENKVEVAKDVFVDGVYDHKAFGYRLEASSDQATQVLMDDHMEKAVQLISGGGHRVVTATDNMGNATPGHLEVWANVLNHQFLHSPEMMAFVKGDVRNAQEFAAWVRQPENAYIIDRMEQYGHDPVGWGSRLTQLFHDYVPTPELATKLADGRISPKDLKRMFPEPGARPDVHGRLADVNTGRLPATRHLSNGIQRAFRYLADVPTDTLSRHPYMNAIYKREVTQAYNLRVAQRTKAGQKFTQKDVDEITRMAREKSLAQLKQTLWDVSAHSHGAHVMRFLSPFFAAHQEALARWWNIAKSDPSVVRRFQLAFDAPRQAGMTYNPETGEVGVGSSIGDGNRIMLKLPGPLNSGANRWLKSVGGDKFWSVSENGLNLILQNGIANPGVGPVVSIPLETLVQKYADEPNLLAAARVLNQYPPQAQGLKGIATQSLMPAGVRNLVALLDKDGETYGRDFMQNYTDELIEFQKANGGRIPTDDEFDKIVERAGHHTTMGFLVRAASNFFGFTPVKPESKYAVVQHGLRRIQEQARQEGQDQDWVREQFKRMYGDIYLPMIYSLGANPARLDQTPGEISAMKSYRGLLNKVDVSLTRMVIGPEAAMSAEADPEMGRYSDAARNALKAMRLNPLTNETYIGSRSLDEASLKVLINQGWEQYEQLTNWLDVEANRRGLKSYDQDEQLVAVKSAGLAYIKENNFAFRNDFDSFSRGGYEKKLDDMRQIASDKRLLNDPMRSDVYWLGQYLMLRDAIGQQLAQRAAAGGALTMEAQANTDLRQAFAVGVSYINDQSSYFKTFHFLGLIERDPWLDPSTPAAEPAVF